MAETAKPTVTPPSQKELDELRKQLKAERGSKEELELKIKSLDRTDAVESNEVQAAVENLQKQLEELQKAQRVQPTFIDGKKPKYRTVLPEDIGDDTVTFTARCVMKPIPGYMDENGVEILAPHRMILLRFAASDIRQDGKEEEVLNFCNYTTKLKSEIDFLKGHPEYGITFGDNMDEVAGHDVKEYQFKTKAAAEVASMAVETIIEHAKVMEIPNWQQKSNRELKGYIVANMVKQYMNESSKLQDELKKRIFEQAAKMQQK